MPSRFPDTTGRPLRAPSGDRVLTRPLLVFWVLFALTAAVALRAKYPRPGLEAAVLELTDGDLDGDERRRMLRIALDAALTSAVRHGKDTDASVRTRWVGLFAALALEDAAAFARAKALLGDAELPAPTPPAHARADLDLGDPLVRNVVAALFAEADGDPATARAAWQRVRNQCRLSHRPLAASLAEAALRRLS